ncbi:MAG: hypothetical protein ACRDZ1_16780 [Acidimicrobiia bacterium]
MTPPRDDGRPTADYAMTIGWLTALEHNDDESAEAIIAEANPVELAKHVARLFVTVLAHAHEEHGCTWTLSYLLRSYGLEAARRAAAEGGQ